MLVILLLAPLLVLAADQGVAKRASSSHWVSRWSLGNAPRVPNVTVGGLELAVHTPPAAALSKRDDDENPTIIALAELSNSYIVPVALGSPAVAYPLQLDTGSADMLIASKNCGNKCPASTSDNPYYDPNRFSSSFESVHGNGTLFSTSFGDGTTGSGIVARERVGIANVTLEGQVFGLLNQTNLTLAEQKTSGIIGLGFPRLSVISRSLIKADVAQGVQAGGVPNSTAGVAATSPASGSGAESSTVGAVAARAAVPSSSSVAAAPTAAATTPATAVPTSTGYLPPLLESLVRTTHIPYPVFALALSPPSIGMGKEFTVDSPRYSLHSGSLTLGGVSAQYVSDDPTTGRTVNDIEWHDVVPFSPLAASQAESANATEAPGTASADVTDVATDSASVAARAVGSSPAPAATTAVSSDPSTIADLENEAYLYWAVQLARVSVNGTDIGLNSSYASIGVPSVALLDIGNNGIYGPQQDVQRLFKLIPLARQVNAGQWAVPCSTMATLSFSFGGRDVVLQPSDWIYAAVAGSSMCLAWPVASPEQGDGVDWTLGTPFLKKVYSVFSYGINNKLAPAVGFLPLAPNTADDASGNSTSSAASQAATSAPVVTNVVANSTVDITAAAPSVTVATTLPNQLLPDLDFATPSYLFATPVLSAGVLQSAGLANATAYSQGPVPVASLPTSQTTDPSQVVGWPAGSTNQVSGASRAVPAAVVLAGALAAAGLLA